MKQQINESFNPVYSQSNLNDRFVYNVCNESKYICVIDPINENTQIGVGKIIYSRGRTRNQISLFVYNVCGLHTSPIPLQLDSKLKLAHPSPISKLIPTKKIIFPIGINDRLLTNWNQVTNRVHNVAINVAKLFHCVCPSKSINKLKSAISSINSLYLQSINIESSIDNNEVDDYTYNSLIISNISKNL